MLNLAKANSILLLCYSIFSTSFAHSESWSQRGEVILESRRFKDDHVEISNDYALSFFSRVDSSYQGDNVKASLRGYARVDQTNTSRNIISFEDTFISYAFGEEKKFNLFSGWQIFNWTATEAFHPADVVNSRNFDSDLENLEKIGEFSAGMQTKFKGGELTFYFFPHYERPRLPGSENRLGLGINIERPVWVDGHGNDGNRWGAQYGAHYSKNLGDGDLALFLLSHMDRTYPLIGTDRISYVSTLVAPSGVVPLEVAFRPYYFKTADFGFTYQHVLGSLIIKGESVFKDYLEHKPIYTLRGLRTPDDHGELALGLEYDITTDGGSNLQFFLEAQSLFAATKIQRSEMNAFQRDGMMGLRYALNDVMGTEFFISLIADLERPHEYLGNFVFMRRLSDFWKVKGGFRYFDAPKKETIATGLENLNQDHYAFFNLMRYF